MSKFIDDLRISESKTNQISFVKKDCDYYTLLPECDKLAEEYVNSIKKELMKKVDSQNISYNTSTFLGRKRQTHPIYEANLSIYYTFIVTYPHIVLGSTTLPYDDNSTPCLYSHSPDLLKYLINKINNSAIQEGLVPFYWKRDRYSYKKTAIRTSFPTKSELDSMNKLYKEVSYAAKKGDNRRWSHWYSAFHLRYKVSVNL